MVLYSGPLITARIFVSVFVFVLFFCFCFVLFLFVCLFVSFFGGGVLHCFSNEFCTSAQTGNLNSLETESLCKLYDLTLSMFHLH